MKSAVRRLLAVVTLLLCALATRKLSEVHAQSGDFAQSCSYFFNICTSGAQNDYNNCVNACAGSTSCINSCKSQKTTENNQCASQNNACTSQRTTICQEQNTANCSYMYSDQNMNCSGSPGPSAPGGTQCANNPLAGPTGAYNVCDPCGPNYSPCDPSCPASECSNPPYCQSGAACNPCDPNGACYDPCNGSCGTYDPCNTSCPGFNACADSSCPSYDYCACTGDPAVCDNTQCNSPKPACPNPHCSDGGWICDSPLIIDTRGVGFHLTSVANGVAFDFTGDGTYKQVAWTDPAYGNAWLALDRNGNGQIDNATELFGNFTPQPPSPVANGFLALAEYDKPQNGGNLDGFIDWRDAVYTKLRLWIDANHNGISEPGELHTLPELGVMRIQLKYEDGHRTDQYGNFFRYRSHVWDKKGVVADQRIYDVFLESK